MFDTIPWNSVTARYKCEYGQTTVHNWNGKASRKTQLINLGIVLRVGLSKLLRDLRVRVNEEVEKCGDRERKLNSPSTVDHGEPNEGGIRNNHLLDIYN